MASSGTSKPLGACSACTRPCDTNGSAWVFYDPPDLSGHTASSSTSKPLGACSACTRPCDIWHLWILVHTAAAPAWGVLVTHPAATLTTPGWFSPITHVRTLRCACACSPDSVLGSTKGNGSNSTAAKANACAWVKEALCLATTDPNTSLFCWKSGPPAEVMLCLTLRLIERWTCCWRPL